MKDETIHEHGIITETDFEYGTISICKGDAAMTLTENEALTLGIDLIYQSRVIKEVGPVSSRLFLYPSEDAARKAAHGWDQLLCADKNGPAPGKKDV